MNQSEFNYKLAPSIGILIIFTSTLLFSLRNNLPRGKEIPIFPHPGVLMFIVPVLVFIVVLPNIKTWISELYTLDIKTWISELYTLVLLLLIALSLFSLVSTLWSNVPLHSLKRATYIFVPMICLFIMTVCDKRPIETFWKVAFLLTVYGVMLSVIGVALTLWGTEVPTDFGKIQIMNIGSFKIGQTIYIRPPFIRISSLTGNPNSLASWLMITINLTLAQRLARRISQLKFIILGGLQAVALFLTVSRAGIGATVIIAVLLCWLTARKNSKILFIITIIITILIMLYIANHFTQVKFVYLESLLKKGLSGRNLAWSLAWDHFLRRPLIGYGIGTCTVYISETIGILGAHNLFLTLLFEVGIFGFILVLAIWLLGLFGSCYIKKGLRCNFNMDNNIVVVINTIFAVLVGLVFHEFFETYIFIDLFFSLYWIYIIGVALNHNVILISCNNNDR
ncbi:O-antigen ligase family protein [Acetomicrobium sp.]|uniref:O-antigen ligase family protein n=1 Tax=Acetomicrobium sp. TaxID=1872099 RepID=UPI001BD0BE39|nr:O-antigen ligase family protein [Acetomicrobium sp.]